MPAKLQHEDYSKEVTFYPSADQGNRFRGADEMIRALLEETYARTTALPGYSPYPPQVRLRKVADALGWEIVDPLDPPKTEPVDSEAVF